jgi:hypothetical protein
MLHYFSPVIDLEKEKKRGGRGEGMKMRKN